MKEKMEWKKGVNERKDGIKEKREWKKRWNGQSLKTSTSETFKCHGKCFFLFQTMTKF